MVNCVKLQPKWTKSLEMTANFVKQFKKIIKKIVFSALSLIFKISKSVKNHDYKYFLNYFNHHRSKWSGLSEKKRPSKVRFSKN